MKIPFWKDSDDSIEILEATKEAVEEYGHRFGSDVVQLRPEHVEALQNGKMLAWHDSEYSTFVVLETPIQLPEETGEEETERDTFWDLTQFVTTKLMPSTPEGFRKAIQTGFEPKVGAEAKAEAKAEDKVEEERSMVV